MTTIGSVRAVPSQCSHCCIAVYGGLHCNTARNVLYWAIQRTCPVTRPLRSNAAIANTAAIQQCSNAAIQHNTVCNTIQSPSGSKGVFTSRFEVCRWNFLAMIPLPNGADANREKKGGQKCEGGSEPFLLKDFSARRSLAKGPGGWYSRSFRFFAAHKGLALIACERRSLRDAGESS